MVLISACGDSSSRTGVGGLQPRDGRSGLVLTGMIDGRQVAVSAGAPRLLLSDCDVNDGFDVDVCFFTQDIDGTTFGIISSVTQPFCRTCARARLSRP